MFEEGWGEVIDRRSLGGGCYGGGWGSCCLSSKAVSFLKLLMEPQSENSGGWVVLPTGCYRKWENLNDISEVERVLGWRVCAWMGERELMLPGKFWEEDWTGACRKRGVTAENMTLRIP